MLQFFFKQLKRLAGWLVMIPHMLNPRAPGKRLAKKRQVWRFIRMGFMFVMLSSMVWFAYLVGDFFVNTVTFSDISIINPAYMVDPNITDETGNSFDIGFRGGFNNYISYDVSSFQMIYNNRIGFIQRELGNGIVKSVRSNIGEAKILIKSI